MGNEPKRTSDDVQRLLESVGGMGDLQYREVAALERWQAAAARWPLVTSTNRVLLERLLGAAARPAEPRRPIQKCFTVVLLSLQGGAGRTTITANLAAALGQNGRQAMAVDLDPQNTLGLHFGMEPGESIGLAFSSLTASALHTWMSRFRSGASVFPFGKVSAQQLTSYEAALNRDPGWLRQRLDAVVPAKTEFLLLDTPPRPGPWLKAALGLADAVLVVLHPAPAAYATLPQIEALLDEQLPQGRRRARYLVNHFDARLALHRDIFGSVRGMLADRAFPFPVQADEVVPEALARRKLIVQEAADSQVVSALSNLAEWLEGEAATLLASLEQQAAALGVG